MSKLTSNAIKAILNGSTPQKPILQVLSMRKIASSNQVDRWRLQISDGTCYQPCMLATQLNQMISGGQVDQYAIISLDKYICSVIKERKIIIIIQMSLVEPGVQVGGAIGSPASLEMKRTDDGVEDASPTGPFNPVPNPPVGVGNMSRPTYGSSAPPSKKPYQPPTSNSAAPTQGGWGAKPNPTPYGNTSGASNSYNRGPVQSSISPGREPHPISSLTPYQNKWTIRVRAVAKPTVRTYSNSRGEGKILSVEFADKTGEIRATAFNEAADKFGPMLEANKVYLVSRARVKPANKKFTSVKNDYELFLQEDSVIEEDTAGSNTDLPKLSFNFTPIGQLSTLEKDSMVDVVGVCKTCSDISSITVKTTNRKVSKRDIELVDMTGTVVSVTIWSNEAEGFDGSSCPVIAIKGARVSDFGGCSLSLINSSTMVFNPDIAESHKLRGWFDNDGKMADTVSISGQRLGGGMQTPWLSIAQVKELNLGHGDKPDYFTIKGFVSYFKKDNCLYQACPKADCNKKVTQTGSGFHCEKCNASSSDFKWRLMLQTCIADWSGCLWFTCFQDQAESLLQRSAEDIGTMQDKPEHSVEYDQIFSEATFGQFTFKLRAKVELYNDEKRLKVTCVDSSSVDYSQNAKRLIADIRDMISRPVV